MYDLESLNTASFLCIRPGSSDISLDDYHEGFTKWYTDLIAEFNSVIDELNEYDSLLDKCIDGLHKSEKSYKLLHDRKEQVKNKLNKCSEYIEKLKKYTIRAIYIEMLRLYIVKVRGSVLKGNTFSTESKLGVIKIVMKEIIPKPCTESSMLKSRYPIDWGATNKNKKKLFEAGYTKADLFSKAKYLKVLESYIEMGHDKDKAKELAYNDKRSGIKYIEYISRPFNFYVRLVPMPLAHKNVRNSWFKPTYRFTKLIAKIYNNVANPELKYEKIVSSCLW